MERGSKKILEENGKGKQEEIEGKMKNKLKVKLLLHQFTFLTFPLLYEVQIV